MFKNMKQVDMSSKNINISISENLNNKLSLSLSLSLSLQKINVFLQGFILAGQAHLEFLVKPNSHF